VPEKPQMVKLVVAVTSIMVVPPVIAGVLGSLTRIRGLAEGTARRAHTRTAHQQNLT
jgi:predicted anti-sigma-YlaC factor YlaD